jgi:flavin reductase (DIM6/NTAB) family NADH-FMN oxidoreductase RutF
MTQTLTVDSEKLRQAMRAWTSGVTIVTTSYEGEKHGMTVSSFTSIALEPPIIIISLQTDSRTHKLVSQSNAFGVTVLAQDQQEISDRFAGRIPDAEDRFVDIETESLVTGAPFIKGGLAYLDCRVTQVIPVGSNTLFLAEVVAARGDREGQPLVYHDGGYRQLIDS